jgi:hypothetical protein
MDEEKVVLSLSHPKEKKNILNVNAQTNIEITFLFVDRDVWLRVEKRQSHFSSR